MDMTDRTNLYMKLTDLIYEKNYSIIFDNNKFDKNEIRYVELIYFTSKEKYFNKIVIEIRTAKENKLVEIEISDQACNHIAYQDNDHLVIIYV